VFVYPWAVVLRELGWAGLWQMVVFLGILGVAFVYEFCRGEELVRSSPRWTDPMLVVSRTGQRPGGVGTAISAPRGVRWVPSDPNGFRSQSRRLPDASLKFRAQASRTMSRRNHREVHRLGPST
jgi:hypothetical protein